MRRSPPRSNQLEGRKREEHVGELRNVGGQKRGLTNWRGGKGRSELVSFKMWQVTNEDSPTGGEEEGGGGGGAWKRGRSQTRTNEVVGGRGEEGGGGRREGEREREELERREEV